MGFTENLVKNCVSDIEIFLATWASDIQGLGPKGLISKPYFSSLFGTTVIYLSNSGEKHI